MDVILLERVDKLGAMGEVVSVRNGYGRNFLLAQGKALRATKANMARFEAEREVLETRNAEARDEAAEAARAIDGASFIIIRQASETGNLYGSVSTRDVADAATEAGFEVRRGQVALDSPVKELGLHEVRIVLHPEVDARVTVNVARSRDEAEIQASGKSISELRAEEEAREAAEAAADFEGGQFDVDALFEDPRDAAAAEEESGEIGELGEEMLSKS